MNVRYVDTHCHLQLEQYANDREEIIEKMRDAGIAAIVVGDDFASSKEAVVLAGKNEHLFAAVGIHPDHTDQESFDQIEFSTLASQPKVVAVGECGLDYSRKSDDETSCMQKKLFKKQLSIASTLNKPVIIHARSGGGIDAYTDVILLLQEAKANNQKLHGVVHFFAGNLAQAEKLFSLGFLVSFTAVITFAHEYDETVRSVSLENILSETDAPFVSPASRRGQRNDSLAVIEVIEKIARIRDEDFDTVRVKLLENAQNLFVLQVA